MTNILQKHYTLTELAKVWHISRPTLYEWFKNEPGVIKYGVNKLTKARKKTLVQMRIPESVARRVYERHTGVRLAS